jgi:hypothetical protein
MILPLNPSMKQQHPPSSIFHHQHDWLLSTTIDKTYAPRQPSTITFGPVPSLLPSESFILVDLGYISHTPFSKLAPISDPSLYPTPPLSLPFLFPFVPFLFMPQVHVA